MIISFNDNGIIDWLSSEDKEHKIAYFQALRDFMNECKDEELKKRWNIFFTDFDEIPRVNIDRPKNDS